MSLNDDSGEDVNFDDLFGDATKINENQPLPPVVAIVNTDQRTDLVCDEKIFGEDLVKNEIPNLAALFVENHNKVSSVATELLDISSSLKKSNGVCKEDAVVIDSISKGFINDKKPLGFFTEDKSKTQYQATLQTLDKEVDLNLAKVIENLNSFCDKVGELTLTRIKELQEETSQRVALLQKEVHGLLTLVSYPSNQTKLPDGFNVNSFLEIRIGEHETRDEKTLDEGIEKLPDDIKLKIVNLRKGLLYPNKFLTRLAHLYNSETHGLKETIFCFGDTLNTVMINGSEISDLPSNHKFAREHIRLFNNDTIYLHSTLVTSVRFKRSLSDLITLAVNLTNRIVDRKAFIKQISLSTEMNINDKLETLDNVSKDAVRDSLMLASILTFFEELLEFLFRLKGIYQSINISNPN